MGENTVRALEDLRKGKFVLVYDDPLRENEVDMVIAAQFVEPWHVARMRKDAGGLICVTLHPTIAENLSLPYLTQVYETVPFPSLRLLSRQDLPYGERSAFSITVNSRRTRTGITDEDRATTIRELAEVGEIALKGPAVEEFVRRFRSPGHVPLLPAAKGLLKERRGHTELSVTLMKIAGLIPVAAICEMLDDKTYRALSVEEAKKYAEREGYTLLSTGEILEYESSGNRRHHLC
jgi:3,4-dihydroxy 2-butanone 4-phosphate synthase